MKREYPFPIILIVLGSFLEIWYYMFRFTSDGVQSWLALIIGASLTLLLAMAVKFRSKTALMWVIIIPLGLYSIFATSAGQAFSLNILISAEAETAVSNNYVLDEIKDLQTQIDLIDQDLQSIREAKAETITSLEDRGIWRSTLATAEAQEAALKAERLIYTEKLSSLRSEATTHEGVEETSQNIYLFYSDLFGFSAKWLQFLLQTLLSAFIAVMSPIGIIMLPAANKKPTAKHKKPIKATSKPDHASLEKWVWMNWVGIRSGKSKNILNLSQYKEFMDKKGWPFDQKEYDRFLSMAIRLKVIASDNRIIEKDEKKALLVLTSKG